MACCRLGVSSVGQFSKRIRLHLFLPDLILRLIKLCDSLGASHHTSILRVPKWAILRRHPKSFFGFLSDSKKFLLLMEICQYHRMLRPLFVCREPRLPLFKHLRRAWPGFGGGLIMVCECLPAVGTSNVHPPP